MGDARSRSRRVGGARAWRRSSRARSIAARSASRPTASPPHKLPDGRPIPGTFADPAELVDDRQGRGAARRADAGGRRRRRRAAHHRRCRRGRLLFSYGTAAADLALASSAAIALEELCAGRDMTAITQVRASGMIYGLQAGLPVRGAAWSRLRRLPTLADRVAALGDAEFHAQLMAEAKANGFKQNLGTPVEKVFYLGDGRRRPTGGREMNLVAMAEARGEHSAETFLRLGRETRGKALFTLRMFNLEPRCARPHVQERPLLPEPGRRRRARHAGDGAGWATFMPVLLGARDRLLHPARGGAPHDGGAGPHHGAEGSRHARDRQARRHQRVRRRHSSREAARAGATTSPAARRASSSVRPATRRPWSTARSTCSTASIPALRAGAVLRHAG